MKATKKTARIEMRMSAQVKEKLREKAKNAGMTLTAYVVHIINAAA